jgi:dolichol-phosphate mannosyltransferase
VAIVVPTRNERDNVLPLIARVSTAVQGLDAEILFVDDSDDDTPEVVVSAATGSQMPVRLVHRQIEHRAGGLGGAVKAGFEATDSEWVVVMDGDLQHPPEIIPELVARGTAENLDVVVASRYCGGGQATGLSSVTRQVVSSGATRLARVLFPRRLSRVTDPMSGFFGVRRAAVQPEDLRPRGFKILLEILVRRRPGPVGEVPFVFGDRNGGASKASWQEGILYLRRLVALRLTALPHRTRGMGWSSRRPLANNPVAPLPRSVS